MVLLGVKGLIVIKHMCPILQILSLVLPIPSTKSYYYFDNKSSFFLMPSVTISFLSLFVIFWPQVFLVALLCALSAAQRNTFRVVSSDIQAPVGALYRTAFQTDNGIQVEESGSEGPEGTSVIRGSYS